MIEVPGRVTAEGEVLAPLDLAAARVGLEAAWRDGFRACAILFMHAWRFPDHERAVAALAREIGFAQVSASHEVSPLMRLVPRGDTTVADAYLSPVLRRYVDRVAGALGGAPLMFMQSSGGLTEAARFQGRDAILSGPAGGIVGAVKTAAAAGLKRIITFDMGGTSTDVAHFDGAYERAVETEVAGVRLRVPMMRIHTVAAGGGSILKFDQGRFQAGPESAGADPGPACYRRGGPLTVTDANLVLGRLQPRFFPAVFGPEADAPLDDGCRARGVRGARGRIGAETGRDMTVEEAAEGFLRIAVDNMAAAIKKISIARGHDVTGYALVSFGGAGGQHACRVADALGMKEVFIHPLAGVLSALGMGLADMIEMREAAVETPLAPDMIDAARRKARRSRNGSACRARRAGSREADIAVSAPCRPALRRHRHAAGGAGGRASSSLRGGVRGRPQGPFRVRHGGGSGDRRSRSRWRPRARPVPAATRPGAGRRDRRSRAGGPRADVQRRRVARGAGVCARRPRRRGAHRRSRHRHRGRRHHRGGAGLARRGDGQGASASAAHGAEGEHGAVIRRGARTGIARSRDAAQSGYAGSVQ